MRNGNGGNILGAVALAIIAAAAVAFALVYFFARPARALDGAICITPAFEAGIVLSGECRPSVQFSEPAGALCADGCDAEPVAFLPEVSARDVAEGLASIGITVGSIKAAPDGTRYRIDGVKVSKEGQWVVIRILPKRLP
jgi:hypothetical protein